MALLLRVAKHVVCELCSFGCTCDCTCEHVGEECFAYSCCERVGRPVAARRISRSCVVAAGLLARGDTRTEERDVRGGGGIWVVMERLWNWGVKSSTRDEERWRAL